MTANPKCRLPTPKSNNNTLRDVCWRPWLLCTIYFSGIIIIIIIVIASWCLVVSQSGIFNIYHSNAVSTRLSTILPSFTYNTDGTAILVFLSCSHSLPQSSLSLFRERAHACTHTHAHDRYGNFVARYTGTCVCQRGRWWVRENELSRGPMAQAHTTLRQRPLVWKTAARTRRYAVMTLCCVAYGWWGGLGLLVGWDLWACAWVNVDCRVIVTRRSSPRRLWMRK